MSLKIVIYKTSRAVLSALFFVSCGPTEPIWTDLSKGDTLQGWEVKGGNAQYTIQNGVITGTTLPNSPNTFLCTTTSYDDFILEFEVLVDAAINSGVQFRSNSDLDFNKGQVHGYQAEIDPSDRAWSGGIYEEGKRGWLYDLKNNTEGRKAFINGQWNHYRIEALGENLTIWVNGTNTANLQDKATPSGFIGLQVHSIGQDTANAGKKIQWRYIRILTTNVALRKKRAVAPLKITSEKSRT